MQILKNLYKISGVEYGTNSNCYAVRYSGGVVMIDAGYGDKQREINDAVSRMWGLDGLPVTHLFLTHSHFDHAGNAHYYKQKGACLYAGAADAKAVTMGTACVLGDLFCSEFVPCGVDYALTGGEIINCAELQVRCISTPGHSEGSMSYAVEIDGKQVLFVGDFLSITGTTPEDEVVLSLPWQGGPDADTEKYAASAATLKKEKFDLIAPGHMGTFAGNCDALLDKLFDLASEELKNTN